ncbi:bifunctional non-homologous end joining protein LigD [Streptomyces sp. WMMB 322]|nr:bifunctional non-homologous end joining protein LigD [Streptomyces sp. WMMB 322]
MLFPDDGITKSELAGHYRRVARRAVPRLRGRALMMERHPDGVGGKPLMQKNAPDYFPDWVHTAELPKQDGTVRHVVCDNADTLVYLAGQAYVTTHRWMSKTDRPGNPDLLVFDLDPNGDADFEDVRWAARCVGGLLEEAGLPTQPMTTARAGCTSSPHWTAGRTSTRCGNSPARSPGCWWRAIPDGSPTSPASPPGPRGPGGAPSGDRVYPDIQRNAYAQTVVAPCSVRARPGTHPWQLRSGGRSWRTRSCAPTGGTSATSPTG